MRKMIIGAVLTAAAIPALAQVNTGSGNGGLVAVNVQDVSILNNFLNNNQIAALNNVSAPITVQVPIGVAANVCNISAAVLAHQAAGAAPCTAKSGSRALAQNVISQTLHQKRGH